MGGSTRSPARRSSESPWDRWRLCGRPGGRSSLAIQRGRSHEHDGHRGTASCHVGVGVRAGDTASPVTRVQRPPSPVPGVGPDADDDKSGRIQRNVSRACYAERRRRRVEVVSMPSRVVSMQRSMMACSLNKLNRHRTRGLSSTSLGRPTSLINADAAGSARTAHPGASDVLLYRGELTGDLGDEETVTVRRAAAGRVTNAQAGCNAPCSTPLHASQSGSRDAVG